MIANVYSTNIESAKAKNNIFADHLSQMKV